MCIYGYINYYYYCDIDTLHKFRYVMYIMQHNRNIIDVRSLIRINDCIILYLPIYIYTQSDSKHARFFEWIYLNFIVRDV